MGPQQYNVSRRPQVVPEDISHQLGSVLRSFPNITYAVAYGSAVFPQKNQKKGQMIDLIFVVDNPPEWHAANLQQNPAHYSFLKYMGPKTIASIQENFGCGVYYNTFANIDNKILKYGIISTDCLLDDLMNWTHAYIPGRLHKPVLELCQNNNTDLAKSIQLNHEHALRTSLLQLPNTSTKFELYYAITELSYIGDSRMIMGEHPNKVYNIVASNVSAFDKIYLPLIRSKMSQYVYLKPDDQIIQDKSVGSVTEHLRSLPSNLQQHIAHKYKGWGVLSVGVFLADDDLCLIMSELASDSTVNIPKIIREAIGQLVWISSLRQTVTGFLSTGVFGSLKYAFEKFRKALFSG